MYNILASEQSEYQHIMVIEFSGEKRLYLDNIFQTSLPNDDYYEILLDGAEPSDDILILGGGDLTSVPVLRRKGIQNYKIVEIDEMVINVCKIFCPVREERYKDKIVIGDAFEYIQRDESYDVIAIDLLGFADLNKLSDLLTLEEFLRKIIDRTKKYFSGFIGCGINGLTAGIILRDWISKINKVKKFFLMCDEAGQIFFTAHINPNIKMSPATLAKTIFYPTWINIPKVLTNKSLTDKMAYCSAI